MNLPEEFYQITILIIAISMLFGFVIYFTRKGKNFRSSRNKRARRQL